MRWLKKLLDHPLTATLLLMAAYMGIAVSGVIGLLSPHTLNTDAKFYYPTAAGALLALLGGALGAASIPRGVWWLERGSIALMVGAILARIYSLGFQFSYAATTWAEAAISISFLSTIILGLLVRLIYIRGLALDPRT